MEVQNIKPFPFDFEDLTPDEQEFINKIYKSAKYALKLSRVGPKGYILHKPYKKDAANIYNMPLRSTDIFVASYQRSGTTWTQELVWLLANNLDYETAAAIPLTRRYPFLDIFMFFDSNDTDNILEHIDTNANQQQLREFFEIMATPATSALKNIPASIPRFVKTHLPMSLLNPNTLDMSKVVYIARDPRDVVVSCFHHARLFKLDAFPGTFKEYWRLFYKNLNVLCPIFEHVKEAWELRNHCNMLFLFYEELSKDLPASIRRVADFLDKQLSTQESDRLCEHLSFNNFKHNKSVNFEELREFGMLASNETFIRKGKTGGWRDYFDEEMTQQAEQWIADNLRDTDLRYPHMNK